MCTIMVPYIIRSSLIRVKLVMPTLALNLQTHDLKKPLYTEARTVYTARKVLKKVNPNMTGIHPKDAKSTSHRESCTSVFILCWHRKWTLPTCPPTDAWREKRTVHTCMFVCVCVFIVCVSVLIFDVQVHMHVYVCTCGDLGPTSRVFWTTHCLIH